VAGWRSAKPHGLSVGPAARHTADSVTYRILALDIDGTILDPFGKLTPSVRSEIAAARRSGLWVILCTGRRFRTALPFALELELSGAIVVHNGVVVKDIASGSTLRHAYLAPSEIPEVISFVRRTGSPMIYVDTFHENNDILVERASTPHAFQQDYLDDATGHFQTVDDLHEHVRTDVVMVSTMADEQTVDAMRTDADRLFGARISTHSLINKNYQGSILEFLSPASGKWAALASLAEAAGIPAEEIIAVGDDMNDIEMLRGAGTGVAMGNAADAVKEAADVVVRSNAEGGVVDAIKRAMLVSS
jgi:Cof subfamily protein (haloacid dehalogenase superfamily)